MDDFEQRGLAAVSSYISSILSVNDWLFIENLIISYLNKELSFDKLQKGIKQKNIELPTSVENFCITLIKGIERSRAFQKARKANVNYFEYVNPLRNTCPDFCKEHINNIYHLSEIMKMKNREIEPVSLFCGGWGCNHDWEPDPFYE